LAVIVSDFMALVVKRAISPGMAVEVSSTARLLRCLRRRCGPAFPQGQ
jgi:hypothetical protein